MLQVRLFNGPKQQDVVCLVDSGADDCLFPASIAESLGIDLKSGERKEYSGIAGTVEAYIHVIEIQIQGFEERLKIAAAFTESEEVPAILGQAGCFDHFKICFERYRWRIEISGRPEPRRDLSG